jgi:hypothetical protein
LPDGSFTPIITQPQSKIKVFLPIRQHSRLHAGGGCFHLFDKLEFGGESPLTIRAWCSGFRYCPDPLGIVTAKQFAK